MNNQLELVPAEIMAISMKQKRKGLVSSKNTFLFAVIALSAFALWAFTQGVPVAGLVLLAVAALFFLGHKDLKKRVPSLELIENLPKIVDKIETGMKPSHPRYLFFKKNEKWGVYDYKYCTVVLPAQYDSISWKQKGQVFTVTEGDKTYMINVGRWNEKVLVS